MLGTNAAFKLAYASISTNMGMEETQDINHAVDYATKIEKCWPKIALDYYAGVAKDSVFAQYKCGAMLFYGQKADPANVTQDVLQDVPLGLDYLKAAAWNGSSEAEEVLSKYSASGALNEQSSAPTTTHRQHYHTISLNCSPELVDEEWAQFKERYASWKSEPDNKCIPFELDEEQKCVNVFCTMATLTRKWFYLWWDFQEKVTPDLGSQYGKGKFLLKATEEKIKLDEEKILIYTESKKYLKEKKIEFEKYYKKQENIIRTPFNISIKTSQDIIKIASQNDIQFVIIAEIHDHPASYGWLYKNKQQLFDAGYKNIAMEFYGMWQQKYLEDYFEGKTDEVPVAGGIKYNNPGDQVWLNEKANMVEHFRSAGIRVIGIETEESVKANPKCFGLNAQDDEQRIDTLDKSVPFALDMHGLLRTGNDKSDQEKKRAIIWVGAAHAEGTAQWLGRDKCLLIGFQNSWEEEGESITINGKLAGHNMDIVIGKPIS